MSLPLYCQESNIVTGTDYADTKNLDIVAIAKLVRKEIASYIKARNLKGLKVSTTTSRFSGGQSLDIRVKDIPFGYAVFTQAYLDVTENFTNFDTVHDSRHPDSRITVLTEQHKKVLDDLKAIGSKYNRTNIDSQSDYFEVKYYLDVTVDYDYVAEKQTAHGVQ